MESQGARALALDARQTLYGVFNEFSVIGLAVVACLMVLGCAINTSESASKARMWRAQLERQQQAARKGGRIGWIGKAGPGVVMTSTKKGVGCWSNDGIQRTLEGSGASWCYNWGVAPVGTAMKDIEFVPMIWDRSTSIQRISPWYRRVARCS